MEITIKKISIAFLVFIKAHYIGVLLGVSSSKCDENYHQKKGQVHSFLLLKGANSSARYNAFLFWSRFLSLAIVLPVFLA